MADASPPWAIEFEVRNGDQVVGSVSATSDGSGNGSRSAQLVGFVEALQTAGAAVNEDITAAMERERQEMHAADADSNADVEAQEGRHPKKQKTEDT